MPGHGAGTKKVGRNPARPERAPKKESASRRATLGAALCLALAWAGSMPAQAPERAPQQSPAQSGQTRNFVIRAQRNEVLVDVRVWDKSGNPIVDLKQSDFHVLEDGAPQEINSFNLEDIARLATASAESGTPPIINFANLPANVQPAKILEDHRLTVLFFDMTSMPVDNLGRALAAAENFVQKQMTPADLVAITTYSSSLRVVQDFTNDRDALEAALHKIRIGESSSLAEAGTEGEAGTTNASGDEVVTQDVSAAFTPDETEFNIFNTDEKLSALQSLAETLRDVPGRKSVIHFSSGIERTGEENDAQLRATTDAANRADVSFYTVDARGLAALPPGGDATSASPAGTAIYTGSAVASQFSSLHGGRETLATLATDTGGRTFYDLNDFSPAFQEVQNENSSYYLLGYSPSNTKSDGRFRRIKVTIDRPGVKVEARPGYYAPKDFRQFTRQDREVQLDQAMSLDTPFVELPMAIEASYFRLPDKKYYVVLAAKIPGSAISFLNKSKTHQTEFDFAWRATDPAGHVASALRDTLPVKLSGEDYERVLSGNILYQGGFELPPGKYALKVVVRENQSGKMGTFEQPLVLPEIGGAGLMLSSVVVSNQLDEHPAQTRYGRFGFERPLGTDSPLRVGSRAIVPSVTRVFRTNQNLYVYLESYVGKLAAKGKEEQPQAQPAHPSPPAVALVFFRGGAKISEVGPLPGKLEKSPEGKTEYFVKIPLDKFPPGRYWMQVNVLDPSIDRAAFTRIPIAVMKPPARIAQKS
jgi:VWFA-related protein